MADATFSKVPGQRGEGTTETEKRAGSSGPRPAVRPRLPVPGGSARRPGAAPAAGGRARPAATPSGSAPAVAEPRTAPAGAGATEPPRRGALRFRPARPAAPAAGAAGIAALRAIAARPGGSARQERRRSRRTRHRSKDGARRRAGPGAGPRTSAQRAATDGRRAMQPGGVGAPPRGVPAAALTVLSDRQTPLRGREGSCSGKGGEQRVRVRARHLRRRGPDGRHRHGTSHTGSAQDGFARGAADRAKPRLLTEERRACSAVRGARRSPIPLR